MTAIDLTVPATLTWVEPGIAREGPSLSLRDAVRVSMRELSKGEFLTTSIVTAACPS